jgi:hypothetical protein
MRGASRCEEAIAWGIPRQITASNPIKYDNFFMILSA